MLALEIELRIPDARSLKEKRQVVKSLVEAPRRRFGVASAEVGDLDAHHLAVLGYVTVSGSPAHAEQVVDSVESFVWSHPQVEVVDTRRVWLEQ